MNMARLLLISFIVLAIPVKVLGDTCQIVGPEAVVVAATYGFQFNVKKVSKKGHCHKLESGSAILYMSQRKGETVSCEATFFKGMELHKHWKIVRAPEFRGNFQYVKAGEPKYGTNQPMFSVRVESKENQTMLELASITLEGPDCDEWKAAFKGGRGLSE